MFEQEQKLLADERMDMAVIVTTNFLHFPVAKLALESGFHMMSDKPATFNLAQALTLEKVVASTCL